MTVLVDQLEFYWDAHLWPRLAGLTDDEYHWEPVPGCWGLRRDADGRVTVEGEGTRPPEPAPVTTIGWRLVHVAVGCFHTRVSAFFGDDGLPPEADMFDPRHRPAELPFTADAALELLSDGYHRWHSAIAGLDEAALARPLGPRGGPFADDSMAALIAHVNRELMHHGGEIGLLRDLYPHLRR
ncbi:MAG TPA: DinB family protein [Pseudonocardiaceae bacterium]